MHSIGPEKLADRLRDGLMTRVAMSPDQPGARVTKIKQPTWFGVRWPQWLMPKITRSIKVVLFVRCASMEQE